MSSDVERIRVHNTLVYEIAAWLRHINRLDDIPGAKVGLPQHSVLWDASFAIENQFVIDKEGSHVEV